MAEKNRDDLADALAAMSSGNAPAEPQQGAAPPPPQSRRPVTPGASRPPAPAAPPVRARPVTPMVRTRPQVPNLPNVAPVRPSSLTAPVPEIAGEDAGFAPPVDELAHVHRRHVPISMASSLDFKRTLIPVLLTMSLCSGFTGLLHWLATDSFFGIAPIWFSMLMFVFAIPLLGGAIFMMVAVHHQMKVIHEHHNAPDKSGG